MKRIATAAIADVAAAPLAAKPQRENYMRKTKRVASIIVGLLVIGGTFAVSPASPASADGSRTAPNSAEDNPITIMAPLCASTTDSSPHGAKGCFLDQYNGNDDAISACDTNGAGEGYAHVTIYEEHGTWPNYYWTHEVTEKDGPDDGCDMNDGFNIGAGNQWSLRVCYQFAENGPLHGCEYIAGWE